MTRYFGSKCLIERKQFEDVLLFIDIYFWQHFIAMFYSSSYSQIWRAGSIPARFLAPIDCSKIPAQCLGSLCTVYNYI
jgi:hypothetical protein